MAGRSDITAPVSILTRQQCNTTRSRVILRERDMVEEGSVPGKSSFAISHTPIRQDILGGHSNSRLNLKEGPKKGEVKMEEKEDVRQKKIASRRWADKLAKSLPNWPTVMPGPGHF